MLEYSIKVQLDNKCLILSDLTFSSRVTKCRKFLNEVDTDAASK